MSSGGVECGERRGEAERALVGKPGAFGGKDVSILSDEDDLRGGKASSKWTEEKDAECGWELGDVAVELEVTSL